MRLFGTLNEMLIQNSRSK